MDNFKGLIKNYKYLVLGNDSTCNCYRSLRDISTEIVVDYTTISKKLKLIPRMMIQVMYHNGLLPPFCQL